MVEGTPLLRAQTRKGLEGSNPFVSATHPLISLLFPFWRRFPPCFRGVSGVRRLKRRHEPPFISAFPPAVSAPPTPRSVCPHCKNREITGNIGLFRHFARLFILNIDAISVGYG